MKNIKKKIEVFCLVMMMCAMSIVPNMNVNAADAVDGKYGTFTRIEPTADQIASHDKIQYYAGSCSASLSISDYDVYHTSSADNVIDDDSKYVFPYSVKVTSHATSNGSGNQFPGVVYVFAYNNSSLEKNNECLVCEIPFSAPKDATASTSVISNSDDTTKYYANHFGTYIKMEYTSIRVGGDPPHLHSQVDVSVYFNAYPDPYIDTALSNITPVVEGANVPLDGTAEFPCANEHKSYQWQYATSSSYTDSAAASADDTETKWTDCTDGTLYGSSKASVLTIKSTPKSLNKYYYRCKYDIGLPGSVISYSNATQLLVTDANITSITAKTKNKSYEVGDTVSLSDITVTTNWDNSNIIDVIGTSLTGCQLYDGDTLLDGGTYTCDTLYKDDSKKTLKVVYNPDDLDLSAVASDMIAEVSFNVTDTTAPKIDSAVVANSDNSALTVSTTSSDKKNILVSASDNYTKADSLSYKLSKYNTSTKKYDAIAAYTDWSSIYDSKTSKGIFTITGENGNGTYRIYCKDEFDNETTYDIEVKAWDDTEPTHDSTVTISPEDKYSTYRYIVINADEGEDSDTNIVSGNMKYYIEKETDNYVVKDYADITGWSTVNSKVVTDSGTYHVYIADMYGNVNSAKSITVDELNIDNVPPVVSVSIADTDDDDKKLVTIKAKDVARNDSVASGIKGDGKDTSCFSLTPSATLSAVTTDGDYTCTTFTADTATEYVLNVYDNVGNETTVSFDSSNLENVSKTDTVVFVDYDGSVLKTQAVSKGEDATAPTSPTRTGYTFTGWSTAFTGVTSNLTVTAQYKAVYVTVKWNTNGGSSLSDTSIKQGETVSYTTTSKTGYTLVGWYSDSSLSSVWNFNSAVDKDMTLYAKWEEDKSSDDDDSTSKNGITINNNMPDSTKDSSKTANTSENGKETSNSSKLHTTDGSEFSTDYFNSLGSSRNQDNADGETDDDEYFVASKRKNVVTVIFEDQNEKVIDTETLPWGSPVYVLDSNGHLLREFSVKSSRTFILDAIKEQKGYVSAYHTYTDDGVFILKEKYSKIPVTKVKTTTVKAPVEEESKTDNSYWLIIIIGVVTLGVLFIMLIIFKQKAHKKADSERDLIVDEPDETDDDSFTDAESLVDDSDIETEEKE